MDYSEEFLNKVDSEHAYQAEEDLTNRLTDNSIQDAPASINQLIQLIGLNSILMTSIQLQATI